MLLPTIIVGFIKPFCLACFRSTAYYVVNEVILLILKKIVVYAMKKQ
jgi:hypothetical protein